MQPSPPQSILEHFHRPLKKPLSSHSPFPHSPRQPLIYLLPLEICLSGTFHIDGAFTFCCDQWPTEQIRGTSPLRDSTHLDEDRAGVQAAGPGAFGEESKEACMKLLADSFFKGFDSLHIPELLITTVYRRFYQNTKFAFYLLRLF